MINSTVRASRVSAHVTMLAVLSTALVPAIASAQNTGSGLSIQLPTVLVTAEKEPTDAQRVPASVTPVVGQTIQDAGLEVVSDAGVYAPNVHFSDFSARKLSNARFRGIGGSPANPSVTTYFDGVPQLHANTANIDLLDVDLIEFVRGPQSTLFGRNTIGGVINVSTKRPALGGDWSGHASVPLASDDMYGVRGAASGPIGGEKFGAGVAFNYLKRDGYTTNLLTGNTLDSREAFSWKGQGLWKPASNFEARVVVSGERDSDGDYALSDLGGLRTNPFQTARDFEGFTERDIFSTAIQTRWDGSSISVSTSTGIVDWSTEDHTDLDYLPVNLATRINNEDSLQFTQEVRVASSAMRPVQLSNAVKLGWQAGALFFTQSYNQDAQNTYSPLLLSLQFMSPISFSVVETSPLAELDDIGIGVYGQGTVTVGDKLDLIAGVRVDHEKKEASLQTFTAPALQPPTALDDERDFTDVSPRFAAAYRVNPSSTVYGAVTRGYRAGGFNPASLPGTEAYEEEHSWNVEGGVKTLWAGGRVMTNASVFRIDWEDMQLNLPSALVPGQFYIANAGASASTGIEAEVNARAAQGVDVFGSFGYTHARFEDGVLIGTTNVGGNEIFNTPEFTSAFGVQLSHMLRPGLTVFGRAETSVRGSYFYDEANTEGQDTYSLTNLRGGVRFGMVVVEAWLRNAFDEKYIPVAFSYGAFAPSGFIGEMGAPRTFGVNLGVDF
jgi:iron complex outermembrane receptor protein